MNRLVPSMLVFLFGQACTTTDYEGFKRLENSVHYRLVSLGDDDHCIDTASHVSMRVEVATIQRQTLAMKNVNCLKFSEGLWSSPINEVLLKACEGDSLEIIGKSEELDLSSWFSPLSFKPDSQHLRVIIAVNEIPDDTELLQLRAEERLLHDQEMKGYQALELALDSLDFSNENLWEGIYFKTKLSGNGVRIASGNLAIINYRAYLPDGTLIDNTYNSAPFEYHVGKPDQVIEGFAIALSRMHVGGSALFIIPHQLAFGSSGSSSGIVPPYSAVIYEAELIEVR